MFYLYQGLYDFIQSRPGIREFHSTILRFIVLIHSTFFRERQPPSGIYAKSKRVTGNKATFPGSTAVRASEQFVIFAIQFRLSHLFRNSAKRIHLSEIKRVRRMTPLLGNELATVLIAAICIALLVRVTL